MSRSPPSRDEYATLNCLPSYYQEMFETQAKPTTDGVVEACNLASRFQRTKSQIHGWRSWNVCTIVLKLREVRSTSPA